MATAKQGKLIIIGGHEDKEDEQIILKEVVNLVNGKGSLLLMTIATREPEEMVKQYRKVFKKLGVDKVDWLDIRMREDGLKEENIEKVKQASVLFFTGGDQLRITSQMGDTPIYSTIHECFEKGMHVVGTSAGAAVLPETMLVYGGSDESYHIGGLNMAPGLGLIHGVVIDSHFAERGRMGRLLGAVAQNPANIGLGIDENTAIIVDHDGYFRVIGEGAVYIANGTGMTYSSLGGAESEDTLTVCNVRLDVLGADEEFDLRARRPVREMETEQESASD